MSDPEYAELSTAADFVRRIIERHRNGDPHALDRVALARNEVARAAPKARIHARQTGQPDNQALAEDLVESCLAKLDELEGKRLHARWTQRADEFEKNLEAYNRATLG
jgi:hypothetical protein